MKEQARVRTSWARRTGALQPLQGSPGTRGPRHARANDALATRGYDKFGNALDMKALAHFWATRQGC